MHHRAMTTVAELDPRIRAFVESARRATLATIAPTGLPRLVPICFVVADATADEPITIVSPIDEKPKAVGDVLSLARIRDILAEPRATLLIDRWSEDWRELGWVRLECAASVVEPAASPTHAHALEALRAKYPQYRDHDLESRPMLHFAVERVVSWGDLDPGTGPVRAGGDNGSSSSPGGSRPR